MSERKWGEGHLAAMARLGLKELRNAANPSRESIADSEIGLYGSLTQGEIAQARSGPGSGPEEESPQADMTLDQLRELAKEKSEEQERGKDRGQEQDRGMER
jgi:hypothetical protein